MANALIVEIFGDARQFGSELDKAAGKTAKFGAAAKLAGVAVAAGLAVGLEKSIKAGEQLKVAQDSLATAIKHTGGNATVLMGQYNKTAEAAAKFGINQTDATRGLARATVLTGSAAKAQRAYQEALVISKATGKDFNAVLTATSKGQEGVTTSLQRYGILLAAGTPGQEQFNKVMARFGGQAEANTTATQKLSANFQNLEAHIGAKLLPAFNAIVKAIDDVVIWLSSPKVSGAIRNFATVFVNAMQPIIDWFRKNWPEIKRIIVTTLRDTWAVVRGLITVFQAGWREFGGTIKTIVRNDFQAIKGTIEGVVRVIKGVVEIVRGIAHGDWTQVWHGIKDVVGGAVGAIVAMVRGMVGNLLAVLEKFGSMAGHSLLSAFRGIGSAIAAVFKAPINAIIDAIDAIELPSGIHIKTWHGIPSGFSVTWTHPFHIPELAQGGIVNSPTLAMIGEAGPEAVIPLSRGAGALGGSSVEVNVGPVYGTVDSAFARELARQLATQLRGGRSPQLQQAIKAL